MSEAAAPAAPAAPTQATEAAPAASEATKPVDPLAELDVAVSKAGLKYKAAGKEKPVSSIKELLRKAEQADGLQARVMELSQREEKIRAIEERDAKLQKAKTGKERAAILREYAGEAFDEAAEEAVWERIQREKTLEGLTPQERAAREEAESYKARLAEFEAKEAARTKAEEDAKAEAEYKQLEDSVAGLALKALKAANLPAAAAPDAGRRLAFLMARSEQLGLNLEPEELAQEAVAMAGRDLKTYAAGLDGDALIGWLGEDVVRKASKAWLNKMQGGASNLSATPPPATTAPRQTERQRESPITAWKKFGI